MAANNPSDAEVERRFLEATSGPELADLRGLDDDAAEETANDDEIAYNAVEIAVPARLLEIGLNLGETELGLDFRNRITTLLGDDRNVEYAALFATLGAYDWFLDAARGDGLALTGKGYLKPVDVEAASQVVPRHWSGYGKNNRETNAREILRFRTALQKVGLLRKYKGKLLLTRAGAAAADDPTELWEHLIARLLPDTDGFERDATLIALLHAATATGGIDLGQIAETLSASGWRAEGDRIRPYDFLDQPPFALLGNLTADPDVPRLGPYAVSEVASVLAREALVRPPFLRTD